MIFGHLYCGSIATYNSTIQMSSMENRLFDIDLPDFLLRFKQAGVNQILPALDGAIAYLNQTDNPLLMVLLIILFVQLLRVALVQPPQTVQTGITAEQRQLGRELKELKKELKSIQSMLIQLKELKPIGSKIASVIDPAATHRAIESCKASLSKREAIAEHILDWQTKIIEQVIKLKKRAGGSRSPSKISIIQSNKKVSTINNVGESARQLKKEPPKKAPSAKKNSSIQKIHSQAAPYTITIEKTQITQTEIVTKSNRSQVVESIRQEKTETFKQQGADKIVKKTESKPIIQKIEQIVVENVEEPAKIEEIKQQTVFVPTPNNYQSEESTLGFDNVELNQLRKQQAPSEQIVFQSRQMPKPPKVSKRVPPAKGAPIRVPKPVKKGQIKEDPILQKVEQTTNIVEETVQIEQVKVQTSLSPAILTIQKEEASVNPGFDSNEGNLEPNQQVKPETSPEEIEIVIPDMPKPPKIVKKAPLAGKGAPIRKPPPPIRK